MHPHRPVTGRRAHGETGFTLIELLVVITILGILAGIVVFAVNGIGDKGKASSKAADSSILRTAEEAYCAQKGTYATVDDLFANKFLATRPTYNYVSLGSAGTCGTGNTSSFSIFDPTAPTAFLPGNNPDGQPLSALPVGTNPRDLAVDAKSNMIYVANAGSSDVTVIDGANDTIVDANGAAAGTTIAVGAAPTTIAVDSTNHKVYVGYSGGVSIIDPTKSPITVSDQRFPAAAADGAAANVDALDVNPENGDVYVGSGSLGQIMVIDASDSAQDHALPNNGSVASNAKFAFNTKTHKVFVGGTFSDDTNAYAGLFAFDAAAPHAITTVRFATVGSSIGMASGTASSNVAVDEAKNKVYAPLSMHLADTSTGALRNASATVVVSAAAISDGTTNGVTIIKPNPIGISSANPDSFVVNPNTGLTYSHFAVPGGAQIKVFDGTSYVNSVTADAVPAGGSFSNPTHYLAINPTTNRVYYPARTQSPGKGGLLSFDGSLLLPTTIGQGPPARGFGAIAVNPVTNKVYTVSPASNVVAVLR